VSGRLAAAARAVMPTIGGLVMKPNRPAPTRFQNATAMKK
jgi:hypothetical protein